MQLEHGAEADGTGAGGAAIADAVKARTKGVAADIGARLAIVAAVDPRPDARAQHGRRKARALFIGPVDQHQRRLGAIAGTVQRAQHLKARQHPKDAVEPAAGRLGVQMAAHGDGGQVGFRAGTGRKHVADLVHDHGHAKGGALPGQPVPHAAVVVRQRQPGDAAIGRAADPRGFHQAVPQPFCVDPQIGPQIGPRIGPQIGHGVFLHALTPR